MGGGVGDAVGLAVGVAGTAPKPQPVRHTRIKSKMMGANGLFTEWVEIANDYKQDKIRLNTVTDEIASSLTRSLKNDYTLPAGV